jgi:hypothetical protein
MAMEVPEFDLFKRIENLEQRTKGELTIRDASMLGLLSLESAYLAMSLHAPQLARKYKDNLLGKLKKMGFNKQWLDLLEADFLDLCEGVEKMAR